MKTELIDRLYDIVKEIDDEMNESLKQSSPIDKKIINLYHILELTPLNAVKTTKVTKELKETLRVRRENKKFLRFEQSFHKELLEIKKRIEVVRANIKLDVHRYTRESEIGYQELFGEEKVE